LEAHRDLEAVAQPGMGDASSAGVDDGVGAILPALLQGGVIRIVAKSRAQVDEPRIRGGALVSPFDRRALAVHVIDGFTEPRY
jgi:hypothetical protein